MFINFTNHPSRLWSKKQKLEASKYGAIKDILFPLVDPNLSKKEIVQLAELYSNQIMNNNPSAVLIQGEMTLSYQIINILKQTDIKLLCACSKRISIDKRDINGNTIKKSIFKFVQFREY